MTEQDLSLQLDALKQAGCEKIFQDQRSGVQTQRLGLQNAFDYLRTGDILVVWRLDRLGCSIAHLLTLIAELNLQGVGFQSIHEAMDMTTSGGRLIFHIFGALAEFERNLIQERTATGIKAARARGRKGGRPKSLDGKNRALFFQLYDERSHSVAELCELFSIFRSTLYSYLAQHRNISG